MVTLPHKSDPLSLEEHMHRTRIARFLVENSALVDAGQAIIALESD